MPAHHFGNILSSKQEKMARQGIWKKPYLVFGASRWWLNKKSLILFIVIYNVKWILSDHFTKECVCPSVYSLKLIINIVSSQIILLHSEKQTGQETYALTQATISPSLWACWSVCTGKCKFPHYRKWSLTSELYRKITAGVSVCSWTHHVWLVHLDGHFTDSICCFVDHFQEAGAAQSLGAHSSGQLKTHTHDNTAITRLHFKTDAKLQTHKEIKQE